MPDIDTLAFQQTGIVNAGTAIAEPLLDTIKTEYRKALNSARRMNYNQLAGLHNPWGKSAHLFDSWALLDICQSEHMLTLVTPLIGEDVVLWESTFYSYSALTVAGTWVRHSDFSPIKPMQGVSVRIAIEAAGISLDYIPGSHIDNNQQTIQQNSKRLSLPQGGMLCQDIRLAQRYSQPPSQYLCGEYVIHYMPATSVLVRDPLSSAQRQLAEKMPLINYGKSPLWLVSGSDRQNNDFATGFAPPIGQWTHAQW